MVEAQQAAREFRHKFLGTEHVLLGVLAVADGELAALFATRGVQSVEVRERVMELVGPSEGPLVGAPPFTPRALHSLQLAGALAAELGHERVDDAHLVLGLLAEGRGLAAQLLHAAGIGEAEVLVVTSAG